MTPESLKAISPLLAAHLDELADPLWSAQQEKALQWASKEVQQLQPWKGQHPLHQPLGTLQWLKVEAAEKPPLLYLTDSRGLWRAGDIAAAPLLMLAKHGQPANLSDVIGMRSIYQEPDRFASVLPWVLELLLPETEPQERESQVTPWIMLAAEAMLQAIDSSFIQKGHAGRSLILQAMKLRRERKADPGTSRQLEASRRIAREQLGKSEIQMRSSIKKATLADLICSFSSNEADLEPSRERWEEYTSSMSFSGGEAPPADRRAEAVEGMIQEIEEQSLGKEAKAFAEAASELGDGASLRRKGSKEMHAWREGKHLNIAAVRSRKSHSRLSMKLHCSCKIIFNE